MQTNVRLLLSLPVLLFSLQTMTAQEENIQQTESLKAKLQQIADQEKDALKMEITEIDKRLRSEEISAEEARQLKEEAARKRALNIEDRQAIIEKEISLLERNEGAVLVLTDSIGQSEDTGSDQELPEDDSGILGISYERYHHKRRSKYDRRTFSNLVLAFGFNNALIDGTSLSNSPYKIGGSRFFEIGWAWRTRVFENSNWLRFHYGFSFQFNGLKPKNNQYFVYNGTETVLEPFEFQLKKSKLRMDNLVFPVHFEFGPSNLRRSEHKQRYSLRNRLRIGLGAYGGFNMSARQKLKYVRDGRNVKEKIKGAYNTYDLIYGLSTYVGMNDLQLYLKYDLNPIFRNAQIDQRMISLGLRLEL